jgi:hypothetical protein
MVILSVASNSGTFVGCHIENSQKGTENYHKFPKSQSIGANPSLPPMDWQQGRFSVFSRLAPFASEP